MGRACVRGAIPEGSLPPNPVELLECDRASRVFAFGMAIANEKRRPPEGRMDYARNFEFLTFTALIMSILGILWARGF